MLLQWVKGHCSSGVSHVFHTCMYVGHRTEYPYQDMIHTFAAGMDYGEFGPGLGTVVCRIIPVSKSNHVCG